MSSKVWTSLWLVIDIVGVTIGGWKTAAKEVIPMIFQLGLSGAVFAAALVFLCKIILAPKIAKKELQSKTE